MWSHPLMRRKDRAVSRRLAAVHRSTCMPSRQRFTFRLRSRTPLFADSMMFVLLSDSRSSFGSFRRWTVSVSSRPSSRLFAASGLIRWSWSANGQDRTRFLLAALVVCLRHATTDPRTVVLRQIFQDVAFLVDRAALDRGIGAQNIVHRSAQGFRTIDHHQDRTIN